MKYIYKLFVLAISTLYLFACGSDQKPINIEPKPKPIQRINDLTRARLKGHIKQMKEYNFPSFDALAKDKPDIVSLSEYDSLGWLWHSEFLLPAKKYTRIFSYQYKKDSLITIDQVQKGDVLEQQQLLLTLLEANGNPKTTIYATPKTREELYRVNVDYTPQGEWTEKRYQTRFPKPFMPCRETRVLDKNLFPIADYIYVFTPDGECGAAPTRSQNYQNNSNGERTEMLVRNGKNELMEHRFFRYKYDEIGNWTEQVAVDSSQTVLAIVLRKFLYY